MNFKKLTYLCMQRLTNFPYIEEDFDALTNYELLSKVVEYLNKVIENENNQNEAITELANEFTELKNYIDNYFENLDVQEEINNKLDEMALDGTLTNLISSYINPYLEAQDIKIDNKLNANLTEYLKNNFILTVSYDELNHYFLYISQDGINYFKLKELSLPTTTQIWDISVLYKNGYFYLIGDTRKNDVAGTSGGDTIRFFKTNDFETFETWDLDGLSLYNEIWAPEFFENSGNTYIIATMSLPTEQSDYQGFMHKPYLIGLNSNLTEISSQPTLLNLYVSDEISVTDRIDAHLIYDGTSYYLSIKSRVSQDVQLFKSSTLTGNYDYLNTFNYTYASSNGKYEAPSIIRFNNTYILTLQGAYNRTGKIPRRYNYVLMSGTIENLQNSLYYLSFNNSHTTMMHFTPLVVSNSDAKAIINNVFKNNGLLIEETNKTAENTYSYGISNDTTKFRYLEKNGFVILDLRTINESGFSAGDTLLTLPKYCNSWKTLPAGCSAFTTYGGVSYGCSVNINLYGELKLTNMPAGITVKQVALYAVLDANEFIEKYN